MFRTKSLSSKEMTTLIQKHQNTTGIKKQNRHASLRSLIADKTIQYKKHMQRLVLQQNNFNLSARKSASKSRSHKKSIAASEQPDRTSVQEFTPYDKTIIDELRESIDSSSSSDQSQRPQQPCVSSPQVDFSSYCNTNPTLKQEKCEQPIESRVVELSQKLISMENENLILNVKIEELEQKLESSHLVQKQKESEVQSLVLTIKMLELKIEKQQQKQNEKNRRKECFTKFQFQGCSYRPMQRSFGSLSIQTELSIDQINNLQNKLTETLSHFKQKEVQLEQIQNYIICLTSKQQDAVGNISICESKSNFVSLLKEFEVKLGNGQKEHEKQRKCLEESVEKLRKSSNCKVRQLHEMLQLAQQEIKGLLKKLREQKEINDGNMRAKMEQELAQNVAAYEL